MKKFENYAATPSNQNWDYMITRDIGHSPFGHKGEKILSEISKKIIEIIHF